MKILISGIGILIICLFLTGQVSGAYPREDYSKVLILHLNFSNGTVNEESVEMQYGHPPDLGLQAGDLHGSLKTSGGDVLKEFELWDPRYQLGDAVISTGNGTNRSLAGAASYSDTADFVLVMPYYKDQMTLDLTDKRTGTLLKSVNFSDAIDRFRATYPGDPGGNPAPGSGFRFPSLGGFSFPAWDSFMNLITLCVFFILFVIMMLVIILRKNR
jgi:hypothetical protein